MLAHRTVERLAGGLLVASFLTFLGHVVTLAVSGTGQLTFLLVLVYGFLIMLSAMTLYLVFGQHDRTLALFGAAGLAVHGMFIVIVCAIILARFTFIEEFAGNNGEAGEAVAVAARALALAMDKIRSSAFIFMGLGLAALGILIAWSGAVARWMGWLGIGSGLLGFLSLMGGLFNFVAVDRDSILVLLTFLSSFGFLVILGVRLLLRETVR